MVNVVKISSVVILFEGGCFISRGEWKVVLAWFFDLVCVYYIGIIFL